MPGAGPVSRTGRQRRPGRHLCCALGLFVVLAGCASRDPPSERATVDSLQRVTRADWLEGRGQWPGERWWRELGDSRLDQLIESALADSPTLRAAQARVRAADAVERNSSVQASPTLSAGAEVADQRLSRTYLTPPQFAGRRLTTARLALDFGWEADFWGRNEAQMQAAIGQTRAARAEQAQARLMLSAAIAQTYVTLVADQARLRRAALMLDTRLAQLRVVARRAEIGLDSALQREQASALVDEIRLAHEALRRNVAVGRNQLVALTGRATLPDDEVEVPDAQLAAWAVAVQESPPGRLPLELIARRPDLAAQLARIASAGSQIRAAEAEFYPTVNLAAFVGLQSIGLNHLLSRDSLIGYAGPAVRLPILDGGRLRTQLALREADYDATVEQYNATLLTAVREVSDQLAILSLSREQLRLRERELHSRRQLEAVAERRRAGGLDSRLLADERRVQRLASEQSMIELQAAIANARVGLSKALGGGYRDPVATASEAR